MFTSCTSSTYKIQEELAVHVKKVRDIRQWFVEAFEGGPSGRLRKYRVSIMDALALFTYMTVRITAYSCIDRTSRYGEDCHCPRLIQRTWV